jgi:hypothetical protein
MTTKHLVREAAWLWLPLFVGVCFVAGFYRSYVDPGTTNSQVSPCPDGSHLARFLNCP